MTEYACRTLEQLFLGYQFENGGINRQDAQETKSHIVLEVYRRLKVALDALEDAETEQDARRILKQFVEF